MFDWWWEFLYIWAHNINRLMNILYKLFLFFSGSAPAEVNMEFTGRPDGNVLATVFSNEAVPKWFALFVILAGSFFLVCFIIAIIRSEWAKDNKEAKLKILISSAKGIMMIILIPAIFGLAISATTTVLNGIVQGMSGEGVSNDSFSQLLFECCYPIDNAPNWNIDCTEISRRLSGTGYSLKDYNYLVAYIGGFIMLFTIGISVFTVVGRIIELVLLYIISPVVFATAPLDEGNRMGIWKDLVISKFLSIAGMIICYYIFFLIMGYVNRELFTKNTFTIKIAKLIVAIAGCLTANKGGLLITNLIGHNTALIEGQQQGIMGQTVMGGAMTGLRTITSLGSSVFSLFSNKNSGALRQLGNNINGNSNTGNNSSLGNEAVGVSNGGTNVSSIINNAQNGSTFTEKANTYTDGKNQVEGGNNKPLDDFNKGTEPTTNNASETMRAGKGFGDITPPTSKPTVDVVMPDSPTVMEMSAPSEMPTADASIKSIMEEGKNLNKGDSDKK